MKAWHFYLGAAVAAGVGFYIVSVMTSPTKKVVVGSTTYRAEAYLGDGGNWYAQVFEGAVPKQQLGPYPTEKDALEQASAFLSGLNVAAFYTVHSFEVAPGKYDWFFDGWSRGALVSESNGPFATKTVAETAGSNWVLSQTPDEGN